MTAPSIIPEFAILGHPNEGKSSLVSTLTEDDSVNISPYPGETTLCRVFPVVIDGVEVIRFTDTPGFQVPRQTLAWFESYAGPEENIIRQFLTDQKNNTLFKDETELFSPVDRGAGIIYVADGSRPLRNNDLAEMKILALTHRPRIAVINNKSDDAQHTPAWKKALQEHFQKVLLFNAHHASYRERIFLLEELSRIHKDYQKPLERVISAFKEDWGHRNIFVAETILTMIETCLAYTVSDTISDKSMKEMKKKALMDRWNTEVSNLEKKAHMVIRKRFKHNIFNINLPEHSILSKDLFDSETWKVLGLSKVQLAAAAATVGGATALVLDLAVAGHSLGLFALLGGAAGAGTALLGAKRIGRAKVLGKTLGGYTMKVGPHRDIRFMFILLDRSLLFYTHIINWAHGKRNDRPSQIGDFPGKGDDKPGLTAHWPRETRQVFLSFYSSLSSKKPMEIEQSKRQTTQTLKNILDKLPFKR